MSDVAAEGAILNEMLDIVAKRAALRTNEAQCDISAELQSNVSRSYFELPHSFLELNLWLFVFLPILVIIACIFVFIFLFW